MNYLSVCSGVEAASQAWMPLGWKAVAFSEIEPFPCAVLASRFPDVPNLGDMSKIHYNRNTKELTNGTDVVVCRDGIDLLVGGTPCQSFSVAGKRAGLEGASGLAYHYARLLGEIQPRWFVWENVPGALSSVTYGDQRDFNFLLQQFAIGGDADLGIRYNLCWRVLDTQYVRVELFPRAIPQRRRRVFVVGHLATDCGGGCEVLLEPQGVRGNTPPRRVKGQEIARDSEKGVGGADDAINCAIRGNRRASERGKLIESDFTRCAYTVTGVQTDSMAAVQVETKSFDVLCSQNIAHCEKAYERAETCRRQDSCGIGVAQRTVAAVGFDPSPRECMKRQFCELQTTLQNGTCPGHHNAVAIRTANTHANGCGVAVEASHTMDGANGQAVAIGLDPYNACATGGVSKTINSASATDKDHIGAVAFKIDSTASNSMKSANPNSGIHKTEVHCALDTTDPNPTKAQGGVVLATPIHHWRTTNGEDVMPTLDTRLSAHVDKQMERNGSYLCGPM